MFEDILHILTSRSIKAKFEHDITTDSIPWSLLFHSLKFLHKVQNSLFLETNVKKIKSKLVAFFWKKVSDCPFELMRKISLRGF